MHRSTILKFTGVLSVVALALFSHNRQVQSIRRTQTEPFGQYSADQIVNRSIPLFAALSPDGIPLQPDTVRASTNEKTGAKRRFWIVDGYSSDERYQVTVVWDANSGQLVSATHSWRPEHIYSGKKLDLKDAVRISGSWMATLGLDREQSGWHFTNEIVRNRSSWHLFWQSGHRKMQISIDPHTGNLMRAVCISNTAAIDPARSGLSHGRIM